MKRKGQMLGALLLAQLLCGLILPYVFLLPLTAPPAAFLDHAAGMSTQIRVSVFLLLIGGSLPFIISLILTRIHPSREWAACAALLMMAGATFVLQIIENAHWLTMLSVSELYSGYVNKSDFEVSGLVLRLDFKWAHYSHILVVIVWLFLLYCLFFRARVVPRMLAVAGLVACALHFGGIVLPVFAGIVLPYSALFGIPLAFCTVAASGWLLVRGMPKRVNPEPDRQPARTLPL